MESVLNAADVRSGRTFEVTTLPAEKVHHF